MKIDGDRFVVKMIPLDIEYNLKLLQTVIQGRSASIAGSWAQVGFKPTLMLIQKSGEACLEDAIRGMDSKVDISFAVNINEKARNVEEFVTTTHPFVLHKEMKMQDAEIEELYKELKEQGLKNQNINVNVSALSSNEHGLPSACGKCEHGGAIASELAKEDRVIESLKTQMAEMKDAFMSAMQTVHPGADFENCGKFMFTEMPSKEALLAWTSRLETCSDINELNQVINDKEFLEQYTDHKPDLYEFADSINSTYEHISKISQYVKAFTSPSSEGGIKITKNERKKLIDAVNDSSKDLTMVRKHIDRMCNES